MSSLIQRARTPLVLVVATIALGLTAGCGGGGGSSNSNPPPGPAVTLIFPNIGLQTGGTAVTISGTNFTMTGATQVVIGGAPATSVVVVSNTSITCVTGASGTSGIVTAVVTNVNGTASSPNAFTYVAFPPKPDPLGDTQIDTDATTFFGEAPIVLCEGSKLYVAWIENRGPGSRVYFNRSTDGGETWGAADTLINDVTAANLFGLRMCADGDNVFLVWVDQRLPTRVFMNASSDGGVTWRAADVQVSQTAASNPQNFYHSICCSGGTLTVVWPSTGGPYFAQRTSDGGSTWMPADVQISDVAAAPTGRAELCCVGNTVHAVWGDNRGGDIDIFHSRSLDGGATWSADARVDTGPGATNADAPEICCEGTRVQVAWLDSRNGTNEVWASSSSDAGATWLAADQQVSRFAAGAATVSGMGLCCEGARVYVTWLDQRNAVLEPFVNRSSNGGASYSLTDVRLNAGVAAGTQAVTAVNFDNDQSNSQICCSGGTVHVTWTDARNGTSDVFLNSSADGGVNWLAAEVRLDTDLPVAGNTINGPPMMCCDDAFVYCTWRDDRNNVGSGLGDVAFQRTVP